MGGYVTKDSSSGEATWIETAEQTKTPIEIPKRNIIPKTNFVETAPGIETLDIKIKYIDEDVPRLKKIEQGDWIDLYAAEDVLIKVGEMKPINLGVAMQLPKGYEAHVVPRSSTFKKWGIIMANHTGIIDESYCGDNDWWLFQAICLRPMDNINISEPVPGDPTIARRVMCTCIAKGDKICQFRIMKKMPEVNLVEVSELGNADRGGIGSTGSK